MTHDPHQCDCEACKTWRKDHGIIPLPKLTPEQREKLLAEWEKHHSGPESKEITLFGRPIVYRSDLPSLEGAQFGELTNEVAKRAVMALGKRYRDLGVEFGYEKKVEDDPQRRD